MQGKDYYKALHHLNPNVLNPKDGDSWDERAVCKQAAGYHDLHERRVGMEIPQRGVMVKALEHLFDDAEWDGVRSQVEEVLSGKFLEKRPGLRRLQYQAGIELALLQGIAAGDARGRNVLQWVLQHKLPNQKSPKAEDCVLKLLNLFETFPPIRHALPVIVSQPSVLKTINVKPTAAVLEIASAGQAIRYDRLFTRLLQIAQPKDRMALAKSIAMKGYGTSLALVMPRTWKKTDDVMVLLESALRVDMRMAMLDSGERGIGSKNRMIDAVKRLVYDVAKEACWNYKDCTPLKRAVVYEGIREAFFGVDYNYAKRIVQFVEDGCSLSAKFSASELIDGPRMAERWCIHSLGALYHLLPTEESWIPFAMRCIDSVELDHNCSLFSMFGDAVRLIGVASLAKKQGRYSTLDSSLWGIVAEWIDAMEEQGGGAVIRRDMQCLNWLLRHGRVSFAMILSASRQKELEKVKGNDLYKLFLFKGVWLGIDNFMPSVSLWHVMVAHEHDEGKPLLWHDDLIRDKWSVWDFFTLLAKKTQGQWSDVLDVMKMVLKKQALNPNKPVVTLKDKRCEEEHPKMLHEEEKAKRLKGVNRNPKQRYDGLSEEEAQLRRKLMYIFSMRRIMICGGDWQKKVHARIPYNELWEMDDLLGWGDKKIRDHPVLAKWLDDDQDPREFMKKLFKRHRSNFKILKFHDGDVQWKSSEDESWVGIRPRGQDDWVGEIVGDKCECSEFTVMTFNTLQQSKTSLLREWPLFFVETSSKKPKSKNKGQSKNVSKGEGKTQGGMSESDSDKKMELAQGQVDDDMALDYRWRCLLDTFVYHDSDVICVQEVDALRPMNTLLFKSLEDLRAQWCESEKLRGERVCDFPDQLLEKSHCGIMLCKWFAERGYAGLFTSGGTVEEFEKGICSSDKTSEGVGIFWKSEFVVDEHSVPCLTKSVQRRVSKLRLEPDPELSRVVAEDPVAARRYAEQCKTVCDVMERLVISSARIGEKGMANPKKGLCVRLVHRDSGATVVVSNAHLTMGMNNQARLVEHVDALRMLEIQELGDATIRLARGNADLVVMCGDWNSFPNDSLIAMVKSKISQVPKGFHEKVWRQLCPGLTGLPSDWYNSHEKSFEAGEIPFTCVDDHGYDGVCDGVRIVCRKKMVLDYVFDGRFTEKVVRRGVLKIPAVDINIHSDKGRFPSSFHASDHVPVISRYGVLK